MMNVSEETKPTEDSQQAPEATPAGEAGSATIPEPDPKKHYFWGTGRR